MSFKCYDREFELRGSLQRDTIMAVNVRQTNHTKIRFSDGRTVSIQQSLTYVPDKGKPTTECTIKCEDDTSDTVPTVKLGYTQAEKEDWLEEEKQRCRDNYETIAIDLIKEYGVNLPRYITSFLETATEHQLRKRFGKAIAFTDTNETNGPQASATQGEGKLA